MSIESSRPQEHDWHPETEKPTSGSTEYETPGGKVSLQWHAIYPAKSTDTHEAVVFLPGVAIDASAQSVVNSLREFANESQHPSFSVTTRTESAELGNSQAVQAEAIRQFISEQKIEKITLVGNSQGVNKALDVNYELQNKNPDIIIQGMILTMPAGLYQQDGKDLKKRFFRDGVVRTNQEVLKSISIKKPKAAAAQIKTAMTLGKDVGIGMVKEFVKAPGEFSKRAKREATEAAQLNERTEDIKVPLVVVLGARDSAMDSKHLIPTDTKNPENDAHGRGLQKQNAREEFMKNIFPNSPAIRVLEGNKLSVHGMHYLRGKTVPAASWHMLQRIEKDFANNPEIAD